MRFSERYGYKKVREIIQIDSMDEPLRNALWSFLQIHVWEHARTGQGGSFSGDYEIWTLCRELWLSYFKNPLDTIDDQWQRVHASLRTHFFGCPWYEAYDFIEFVANNYRVYHLDLFPQSCNAVLEREMSAYRFVNGLISRIADEQEIAEIEKALEKTGPVQIHLRRALELLSDRQTPDYRNSIKESISAVEGLVQKVVGERGTLGQLLKKLEDDIGLHPALRTAFGSLYGYTSDEGGIRHAILESREIGFEDAKFFLVVCSAFINFVESKVALPANSRLRSPA